MRAIAFAGLLLALQAAGPAAADTVVIPIGAQGSAATAAGLPAPGQTEDSVLARYGEPETRHPAVGKPPIERWDYPDFSVYFESRRVVHSVLRHRPAVPVD